MKVKKINIAQLRKKFSQEKPSIIIDLIAESVAEEKLDTDREAVNQLWEVLNDDEKEEYNKKYREEKYKIEKFLCDSFVKEYYSKNESFKKRFSGQSRTTIEKIETYMKSLIANNKVTFKGGGKVYWIKDALSGGKNKGALKRVARRRGLIRNMDEKLSKTDLHKLQKMGKTTAKRAYMAETLRKFKDGGVLNGLNESIEEAKENNDLFNLYNEWTEINNHNEALYLIAYTVGSEEDIEKAKKILINYNKIGHLTPDLNERFNELNNKLYPKFKNKFGTKKKDN